MIMVAGEDQGRTAVDPVVAEADLARTGPAARMGPAEDPGRADMSNGAARTLNA